MHRMQSSSRLGHRVKNSPQWHRHSARPAALGMAFLVVLSATAVPRHVGAVDRDVLSPSELDQIGLVQAWRRHLSVPAGASSIVDSKLYVHKTSPKQYVEVVGKSSEAGAGESEEGAESEKPAAENETGETEDGSGPATGAKVAKPPVYARYLLEIPDVPEEEESLTSTADGVPARSMLDRLTMSGQASFASSGLLDRKEAERRARNDIRRLKRRGIEAEISFHEVPTIRMYTLADDGTLECRDAETGEIVWLQRVGERYKGYSGFGVDDRFLTVVNGSELIKLDTPKGGIYDITRLKYIPTRGPQHCGDFAVVPSVGYRMVAYPLSNEHRDTLTETVYGDALSTPTLAIGSQKLAWGTSQEFVYLLEASGEPTMEFRLNTDGNVNGQLAAASGDRFFFGSDHGQIYGLRATRTGEVMWTRPTGDPIHEAPIVFDDRVLFLSTKGNLMCVDAATGADSWDHLARGISLVIGVIGDRIYARARSGSMVVLDGTNGKLLHQIFGVRPQIRETNIASDRLYLIDKQGSIQCLREPDAVMPTLTVSAEPAATAEEQKKEEKPKTKPTDGGDDDGPFGGGDDPFGGGADPFGGGGDPFGGGGDPFGGGGGDDPFGG
ncbi:outer membrane protein assembly factor BamB family protein [Allorhodopirellula solitaria]|uniref:Outer membrane biogenesis protein BamB n=1 Tax=Allorhodopirellula solitaria TaxID=2527987 RepID=A0A5C5XPY2_9BACT|nr:PQQ-binding-like beta-propeller repeat protein [Allorhodopirellula solitaria]TWT65237.1 outer membrane biogenesis protein BamB [Allorhodopirellula solitaria]